MRPDDTPVTTSCQRESRHPQAVRPNRAQSSSAGINAPAAQPRDRAARQTPSMASGMITAVKPRG